MALSDDQRALLRLLAQREEGYEDIAALMGLGVPEVRARVKEALAELEQAGEAAPAQPRPVEPAPPPAPARPAQAEEPPARAAAEPAPPPPPSPRRSLPRIPLPKSRRRRADLAGGALVLALLALFVSGAVDIGGGSDSDDSAGDSGAETSNVAAGGDGQVTEAVLAPLDGGDASGRAIFGRVEEGPVLQVQAQGLDPSPKGQSYAIWLFQSNKVALRVGAVRVGEKGGIAVQLPVPLDLLGFVANGSFRQVRISRVDDSSYSAEVARAKRKEDLPPYSGETALAGEITGPNIEAGGNGGG